MQNKTSHHPLPTSLIYDVNARGEIGEDAGDRHFRSAWACHSRAGAQAPGTREALAVDAFETLEVPLLHPRALVIGAPQGSKRESLSIRPSRPGNGVLA